MPIFEELADRLEKQIKTGALNSGAKLPSVRAMSSRESISPTTVVQAYELLISRGLIESRPRSGYFVAYTPSSPIESKDRSPSFIPASDVNLDELIRALRMAVHDPKIFPLGAASPLPDFYPSKSITRFINRILREEPDILSEYRFPPGSPYLRTIISEKYRKYGVRESVDSIVTTGGAIESISLSLRSIARPGDIVAIESPIFFGIVQMIKSMGYKVMELPLDPAYGLLPEQFEKAIKKCPKLKAFVTISNFSNPLGSLVPDASKARIVEIANKSNVTIIEDDIYSELYFGATRPRPYKSFDKWDAVITCGSYSKTLTPAFRVGYAISSKFAKEISYHRTATSSGISAIGEELLANYLSTDSPEKHLRFLRSSYKTLTAQYASAVLTCFPEGTRVSQPQGGYVLWVQLPSGLDSRTIQRKALEHSISIAPGPVFSANKSDYVNFLRLNCAIPWTIQAQKAIQRLGKLVHEI